MAKKSARSKGYRSYRPQKESRQLTPKEKRLIAVGFAVIALVVICVIGVPAIVERVKQLKVTDGVVDIGDENIVAVNLGTHGKPRYHRIATVDGAAEGFTQTETEYTGAEKALPMYRFNGGEGTAVQRYYVQSAALDANGAVDSYASRLSMLGTVISRTDVVEEEINGRKVYMMEAHYEGADYETGEPEYGQTAIAYVESTFDGFSVNIMAQSTFEDAEHFADEEAVLDMMREVAATITMCER